MSAKTEIWSIVDMGSNTIRLCIYVVRMGERTYKKILDARETVGLASYVEEGVMTKEGVRAASKALKKLLRTAELVGCKRNFVFATAAIRNCLNSDEVVKAIQDRCCCKVEVISGKQEARLSVRGALETVDMDSGLFFDIGGGSTELVLLDKKEFVYSVSLPYGSLSTWHQYVEDVMPTTEEIEKLTESIREVLAGHVLDIAGARTMCGIGGTMRMARKVAAELGSVNSGKRQVSLEDLDLIIATAQKDEAALSRIMLEINPSRMHTFLPGCIIAREVMMAADLDIAAISKSGVREGYLLSKMKKLA